MCIYIYIYLLDHLLFFTPILKYFTIVLSNNWYVKHYFLFFTFFFLFHFCRDPFSTYTRFCFCYDTALYFVKFIMFLNLSYSVTSTRATNKTRRAANKYY